MKKVLICLSLIFCASVQAQTNPNLDSNQEIEVLQERIAQRAETIAELRERMRERDLALEESLASLDRYIETIRSLDEELKAHDAAVRERIATMSAEEAGRMFIEKMGGK